MAPRDKYNEQLVAHVMARVEPRLKQILAEHGVNSPDELPKDRAAEIMRQVMLEAASNVPGANLQALSHGLSAFTHKDFWPSYKRAQEWVDKERDAFSAVTGMDAAIALASLGLAVAPFDRKQPRILAEPSNDIDVVKANFLKWKSAYVGYSPCTTPFYILVTDCMRTLRERLKTHPQFAQIRMLFERTGTQVPHGPNGPHEHGVAIFARQPGDTIATAFLDDPSPNFGSVMLCAGWDENGQLEGAPNDGFIPVPTAFLRNALADPEIATWIWQPVGVRSYLH